MPVNEVSRQAEGGAITAVRAGFQIFSVTSSAAETVFSKAWSGEILWWTGCFLKGQSATEGRTENETGTEKIVGIMTGKY